MRRYRKEEDVQSLDISPLIDVVFILLIFFMVSTTFIKDQQLEIDRPTASSSSAAANDVIRVLVDESSDVYIDGAPIKIWALQSKLRELLAVANEPSVLVVVDDTVPVKTLVSVVDESRLSGAEQVAVATRLETGQ